MVTKSWYPPVGSFAFFMRHDNYTRQSISTVMGHDNWLLISAFCVFHREGPAPLIFLLVVYPSFFGYLPLCKFSTIFGGTKAYFLFAKNSQKMRGRSINAAYLAYNFPFFKVVRSLLFFNQKMHFF